MFIDVRAIPEGVSTINQESSLESVKDDLPKLSGKMKCYGDANRIGETIYVHLKFKGAVVLQCSRCLDDYDSPVEGECTIIIKEVAGKHGRVEDDDQVSFYSDLNRNDQLDISSAIYDEIMVNMPLKPLCSLDCKGIEINNDDLSIDMSGKKKIEKEIDPRWEALKKLKSK